MKATRRAVLIAPLVLGAAGSFSGAAFAHGEAGFLLIEEGAGPAAQARLATLARQWQIVERIRIPARGFADFADLQRRLSAPGAVRMIALVRPSSHLLCREAVRDARGVVVCDDAVAGASGFRLMAAATRA
jgi:hypothetical protein